MRSLWRDFYISLVKLRSKKIIVLMRSKCWD